MPNNFGLQRNPDGSFSLRPSEEMSIAPPKLREDLASLEGLKISLRKQELSDKEHDPPTQSFLQKLLFDYLQRGNFTSANVFRQQRDEFHKRIKARLPELQTDPAVKDSFSEALGKSRIYKEELDRMGIGALEALTDFVLRKDTEGAEALWQGLSGQDKTTYMNLAQEEGIPSFIGLSLDMGLDPVNYIPFGLLWKGMIKGMRAIPWVKRGGQAIRKAAFTKLMAKLFVPGADLPKEYNIMESFTRRAGYAEDRQLMARFKGLWNKVHGSKERVAEVMTYVKQHPTELKSLSAANQKVFQQISGEIDDIGRTLVARKYITLGAYNKWKDTYMYAYYPHFTRQLSGRIPPSKFELIKNASFVRPKTFANMDEVTDFVKKLDAFKDVASKDEALEVAKGLRQVADQPGNLEKAIQVLDDVEDIKSYAKALQLSHTPEKNFFKLAVSYETEFNHLLRRDRFVTEVLGEFGERVPNVLDAPIAPAGKTSLLSQRPASFLCR